MKHLRDNLRHEQQSNAYNSLKYKSTLWNKLRSKTQHVTTSPEKNVAVGKGLPLHAQETRINHKKYHSLPPRHPLQTAY